VQSADKHYHSLIDGHVLNLLMQEIEARVRDRVSAEVKQAWTLEKTQLEVCKAVLIRFGNILMTRTQFYSFWSPAGCDREQERAADGTERRAAIIDIRPHLHARCRLVGCSARCQ
jgi:hypothetical protein